MRPSWLLAPLLVLVASLPTPAADLPAWKQALQPTDDAWRKSAQDLIFNNESEPETLDPQLMTGVLESRLSLALFEGLVTYDPVTLEARPGVAESWDHDGLTWTFHLRANACWWDGTPLTAADFVASWQHALDPDTAAAYAGQLFPIAGAEDFHTRKNPDPNSVAATAVDAHTLRVVLRQPCPYFLDLVAFPTLCPVPVALIKQWGNRWVRPEHLLGNGPFRLDAWEPRTRIRMVPNEHYWDRAQVRLTSITALPCEDMETAYKLYQDGRCDWLMGLPVARVDELKRSPDYYVAPFLGTYFYRFNCTKPPFDDVRVRKAFSLAVDRRIITEHVLKAGQVPATWFCPDVAGYHHVDGLATDPAAARALLAQAGYGPGGKPFPPVEILFNTSDAHRQVAEAVVQQWRDQLGVAVSLRNGEWKSYLDDIDHQNYSIARSSWIGDYGDPNTFFDLWVKDGGNNHTGWTDPGYDQVLRASQAEADPDQRRAELRQLEHVLVEDQFPIMPLYIYVQQGLLRDKVRGWHGNVRDIHPFQYLWIDG
jgi:oligopeptide transport system substrate-binding protein